MNSLASPRFVISILIIIIAATYDFAVTFLHPTADANLVGAVFGVLNTGGFAAAVHFWISTTAGSKEKDETISNLAASK